MGDFLSASNFSWILREPCVSGTFFSKHSEKGPIGIYLIIINRCITLASMRQLLNVPISSPTCGNAWQGMGMVGVLKVDTPAQLPSMPTPRDIVMSRCHGGLGVVVKAHHSCVRHFPHRVPLTPSTSVSTVSPPQLCVTFSKCQDC